MKPSLHYLLGKSLWICYSVRALKYHLRPSLKLEWSLPIFGDLWKLVVMQ
jgi:hypothetical protein